MKKIVSGIVFILFLSIASYGQEDSLQFQLEKPELDFLYQELFNFAPNSTFGSLQTTTEPYQLGNLPISPLVQFNSSSSSSYFIGRMPGSFMYNPFVADFTINSMAVYSLNDKLKVGGNSFSANSIFDPIPSQFDPSRMNIQGINFFLEYKISDKISIGGSIQVNQNKGPF